MGTEANYLECPHGCKSAGGRPIASTIRGWKKHMSRNHSGYSQEELETIIGTAPKNSESGKAQFLSEADSGPVLSEPGPSAEPTTVPQKSVADQTAETKKLKTEAMQRKVSAKLNKFKSMVASKFPEIVNGAIKDRGPEWQMNEEDSNFVAEQVENCFEILDIEFQVAPISKTFTNPLWVLVFPFGALLLIFMGKAVKNAKSDNDREELAPES